MESNTERTKEGLAQTIGKVIRLKREEKGMTHYALAKEVYGINTHTSLMKKIENGEAIVDVFTLEKILLVFEVDLREFLINL